MSAGHDHMPPTNRQGARGWRTEVSPDSPIYSLPVVHPLRLLNPLPVAVAAPHRNPLTVLARQFCTALPDDGFRAERSPRTLAVIDHAPAPTWLAEDGVGVVVHSEEPTARIQENCPPQL